jgi:hypothetical protein
MEDDLIAIQLEKDYFEPAFLSLMIEDNDDLVSLPEAARLKMLSHYDREVARTPVDLACHINRISLYAKQHDEAGLYSAILDLFYVVRTRNSEQMNIGLALAKPVLEEQDYMVLLGAIVKGDTASLPLPKKAILAKGFSMGLPLIIMHDEDST